MMAPAIPRRVFRGRGGPKDGRLPPKKTKKTPAVRHNPVSGPSPHIMNDQQQQHNNHNTNNKDVDLNIEHTSCTIIHTTTHNNNNDDKASAMEKKAKDNSMFQESGSGQKKNDATMNDCDDNDVSSMDRTMMVVETPCSVELRHLGQRIRNIQSSMTLSNNNKNNDSSSSINHYSSNVLNAILNAVYEWKLIYQRYSASSVLPMLGEMIIHETACLLFGLIQHGLQTGPLSGSKPGYFKRCGSAIASLVHSFLVQVGNPPGITIHQQLALAKWQTNAKKAMESLPTKLPSRSLQTKIKR